MPLAETKRGKFFNENFCQKQKLAEIWLFLQKERVSAKMGLFLQKDIYFCQFFGLHFEGFAETNSFCSFSFSAKIVKRFSASFSGEIFAETEIMPLSVDLYHKPM